MTDPEPSRETLIAQVRALHALVERQRFYIGSMEASRFWKLRNAVFRVCERFGWRRDPLPVPTAVEQAVERAALGDAYQLYRAARVRTPYELETIRSMVRLFAVKDPFDVIVDARTANGDDLDATLRSLDVQLYPHWNVHVVRADAAAPDATAALVMPLVAGDRLEPDALLALALEFGDKAADAVYADSDRWVDDVGLDPSFKPDWSPETFLTRDYVGRAVAFRRAGLTRVGVADVYEPDRRFEALLRLGIAGERIEHVPDVLVHLADVPERIDLARRAALVHDVLASRGEMATVEAAGDGLDVRFAVAGERVLIVIPTRDRADLLERCLHSLFGLTRYERFEVVVVDNESVEPATEQLLAEWRRREPERCFVLRDDGPFNFSRLNNVAVRWRPSDVVVLLNNDTEVISPDWLEAMLGQARRPAVGAVGALLLYEDGTVQHGGVMLGGVLGLAGHAYRYHTLDRDSECAALRFDTNYLAVTGACLMVERRKYDQVGGLDEAYAVAYNDVDLCAKLRRAGYRNVVAPRARLYHHESKSRGADDTPEKRARGFRESELFRTRWPEWSARDPYYNPNLTLAAEDFSIRR